MERAGWAAPPASASPAREDQRLAAEHLDDMECGDARYAYDAAGSLIATREGSQRRHHAWKASGQVARAELPYGRCVDYSRAPLGRRLEA